MGVRKDVGHGDERLPTYSATMSQILRISIPVLMYLIVGCAAFQEVEGISPTDLSAFHVGMRQSDVERIVGSPLHDATTTEHGYCATYRFNRGYVPPEEHKAARAVFDELMNLMSLGAQFGLTRRYQKAVLKVEYSTDEKLMNVEETMQNNCKDISRRSGRIHCANIHNHLYPLTLPLDVMKWNARAIAHAEWVCSNADQGVANSQRQIGDLYFNGTSGLKKDPVRAYVWYSLAVQGNDKDSATSLIRATTELTGKQLEEAQRLLQEWEPGHCQSDILEATFYLME
jgi:hypothetical protein